MSYEPTSAQAEGPDPKTGSYPSPTTQSHSPTPLSIPSAFSTPNWHMVRKTNSFDATVYLETIQVDWNCHIRKNMFHLRLEIARRPPLMRPAHVHLVLLSVIGHCGPFA